MKKYITLLAAWLLLAAVPAEARGGGKGQLLVSRDTVTVQGGLLRVRMRVSYGRDLLNRGETLVFTPVVKCDTARAALSSVVVTGRGKHRGALRRNVPVVRLGESGGAWSFDYDTTIPFEPWMRGASLYVESDERRADGHGHVYEDLLYSRLPLTVAEAPARVRCAEAGWVQIVDPRDSRVEQVRVSGTLPLGAGRLEGRASRGGLCDSVFSEIRRAVAPYLGRPGVSVLSVSVTGYGVPVGDYRRSEADAAAATAALRGRLMEGYDQPGAPSLVSVSWIAEDWDSITTLIDRGDLPFRSAALDVIRNVPVGSGRERQLLALGNGQFYDRLRREVFPLVCRLCYAVDLRLPVEGLTVSSREASLSQLYVSAARHPRSSAEFRDLIDLSERLYPQSPDAGINAAAVALMRGDLDRAAGCLAGLGTLPRAYNNIGVLHLLRGELGKAEVYLRMAEAQGVPEARAALEELKRELSGGTDNNK